MGERSRDRARNRVGTETQWEPSGYEGGTEQRLSEEPNGD